MILLDLEMQLVLMDLATVLNNSSGYAITKVDDNTYTFTASSGTATTGGIRGGGGSSYWTCNIGDINEFYESDINNSDTRLH